MSDSSLKEEYSDPRDRIKEDIEETEGEYETGEPIYQRIGIMSAWAIVVGGFFAGGILSTLLIPNSNLLSFLIFGGIIAFPCWALCTKSGIEWVNSHEPSNDPSSNSQTVEVDESPEDEIICSSCGWKNRQKNNYCHDCGEELE